MKKEKLTINATGDAGVTVIKGGGTYSYNAPVSLSAILSEGTGKYRVRLSEVLPPFTVKEFVLDGIFNVDYFLQGKRVYLNAYVYDYNDINTVKEQMATVFNTHVSWEDNDGIGFRLYCNTGLFLRDVEDRFVVTMTAVSKNPLWRLFGKRATSYTFNRVKNNSFPKEVLGSIRWGNIESFDTVKETTDGKKWYTKVRIWSTDDAYAFLQNAMKQGFGGSVTPYFWQDTEVYLTCNSDKAYMEVKY